METMIERIYLDFINGERYQKIPRMGYSRELLEAAQNALDCIPQDMRTYAENVLSPGDSAGEAQGFILGFKYAVRMLRECDG